MGRMQIRKVALVMVDISGYTQFLTWNKTSVLHAEEIINELLEAIVDAAKYPLTLNKFEGDAVFLFTEVGKAKATEVAADVMSQVFRFFDAFKAKQKLLIAKGEGGCPCVACQNIHTLQLKAFLHSGEAVFKRIKRFEELAGEDVILIHRLMKNDIPANEYIAMTDIFFKLCKDGLNVPIEAFSQSYDFVGEVGLKVIYPETEIVTQPVKKRASTFFGMLEGMRLWGMSFYRHIIHRSKHFLNIPH